MDQVITKGHNPSNRDYQHHCTCDCEGDFKELANLGTFLECLGDCWQAVMEEEGEDQIGEDVSEVLEVSEGVATFGLEGLDLSILTDYDQCSDDHE